MPHKRGPYKNKLTEEERKKRRAISNKKWRTSLKTEKSRKHAVKAKMLFDKIAKVSKRASFKKEVN